MARVDEVLKSRIYSNDSRELGNVLAARTKRLEALSAEGGEVVLGVIRDLTAEQMEAEGIYAASPTFLHCRPERKNCVYDGALLGLPDDKFSNANSPFRRCPTCKTLYLSVPNTEN